jgi:DNA polymerase-3 subunit beta
MISSRTALPILGHILLKTDKGRLKLSATDLEIGINTWIGAKVEKEGVITVPGRLLSDFIATCDDKKVTLTVEKQELALKSEKYQAKIKGTNAEEFPLIPAVKGGDALELPADLLFQAISQVVIACAIDETRPVLAGVLIKVNDNKIKIVSTDSYRLAEKIIIPEKKLDFNQEIIVPAKTMNELTRVLSAVSAEEVKIAVSENQIQFKIDDNIEIISRLIEGNFPNYEQIIPAKYLTQVEVNKDQFANIIKMASLFAREAANNVKIKIDKKGKIEVAAVAAQVGENVSEMPAEVIGDANEISFNAKFISDVLTVLPDNKIYLEFSGKLDPGVIKPTSSKNYLYLIMPLRTE